MIEPSRRGFITGLATLIAAPAIIRAGSLMPVKQMIDAHDILVVQPSSLYAELTRITREEFLPGMFVILHPEQYSVLVRP